MDKKYSYPVNSVTTYNSIQYGKVPPAGSKQASNKHHFDH